jgi:gluconolactonase
MRYLETPPRLIETHVFSTMPVAFRRKGVATSWADANRPGQETDKDPDSFIEGPSFDAEGNLYVVDIPFGRIFKIAPGGEWSLVIAYEGSPNGLKIAADGRILVADYKHGLMELDAKAGRMQLLLTACNSESFHGCNDLHPAAHGDIYFADLGQTGLQDPSGRVYRLSPNGRLDCLIDTGISPNGLALDSRETRAVRGARLARPRRCIRAEWGADRAHQIVRRSGLHECRDRRQEQRPALCHGVGDRHGTGRGHQCS